MLNSIRFILAGVLILATGIACQTSEMVQPLGEEVPDTPALLAVDAFRGNDQYFLRYQRGQEIFYAAGDLKTTSTAAPAPSNDSYDTPTMSPLETGQSDDWLELTRNMERIPVLGIDDWEALRTLLFKDIMPRKLNTGIAVSFDRADYFFFYDSLGRFRARRLIDKPAWYSVGAHIDLKTFFEQWQPELSRFLAERNIHSTEMLFNTGDLDRGAIPFIYINTQSKLIVLVRYDETPENMLAEVPGAHYLQSLWHFIESNTYSAVLRPFSSVASLVSLLSDTLLESGRNLLPDVPNAQPVPALSDDKHMDLAAWEEYLDEALGRPASAGELDFLIGGDQFFPRFIDRATSAQSSIDIRAYIFDNDDVALEIAELLKRRSREGVDVRVLFDGLGTIIASGESAGTLPDDHRAPLSIEHYLELNSSVNVRTVQNTWLAGDHVKTMVIDKQLAYLGGMNIGREYRYDWHDLMIEIRGPVVDEINDEFNQAWQKASWLGDFASLLGPRASKVNRDKPGHSVRLIHTRPGTQEIFELQREAIRRAQGYIYIENAYFTDDVLLQELIVARRRGVDVRVIIPLETDRGLITRNIAFAANIMQENGIRVYLYPGFTHAKAAIFDGWASVGTANLDRLSLKINQEINIATSTPAAVNQLREELFEKDFARSKELKEPFRERWSDHLIEMFGDYVF
ncbi:MAG: phosphatidylserine/phosphatidylglycerophosphate/cardiolipin synthase family protein [Halieaceae bacterium]